MNVKFKILQIKDIRKCNYAFLWWNIAKEDFSLLDYAVVHEGSDDFDSENLEEICEQIFVKFNTKVEGFKGHSLSISDIIIFEDNSDTLYYVNDSGFKKIQVEYKAL